MMVAVTLLAAIMVGLLAMFNQTQKALHVANAQTDVFESGRGAMQMIVRDLTEMAAYSDTNIISSYAAEFPSQIPGSVLPLPGTTPGTTLPVSFSDTYWLARVNDDWRPIGYFVSDDSALRTNYGVGTLYRFSTNSPGRTGVSVEQVPPLFGMYTRADLNASNVVRRVSDGIVHFSLTSVYVTNTGPATNPTVNFARESSFAFPRTVEVFTTNNAQPAKTIVVIQLPAYVDVELGVLEPATLKQFEALRSLDVTTAKSFLVNHAEKIHFLRERVPIRNFVNPYRANEVP
jgi:hypothetical protein